MRLVGLACGINAMASSLARAGQVALLGRKTTLRAARYTTGPAAANSGGTPKEEQGTAAPAAEPQPQAPMYGCAIECWRDMRH